MKKIWNVVLMALVALSVCNCGGGDEPGGNNNGGNSGSELEVTKNNLAGEWKLTAWAPEGNKPDANFPDETHTVYVEFKANGTFKLYQQNVNNPGVVLFEGNFSVNESTKVVAGIYSDGENWGSNYVINKLTKGSMVWCVENGTETSTFSKEAIPAEVISTARPAGEVRSQEIFRFL